MVELPLDVPQYLFDDRLIAYQQRLVRRWLPAMVFPEPVIRPERSWEKAGVAPFGTIVPQSDGSYRMYYGNGRAEGDPNKVLLAVSDDGFRWEKPDLGVVEWRGSRANNIVAAHDWGHDSPSVAFNPEDAEHPYRMIMHQHPPGEGHAPNGGMHGFVSADGLRWERLPRRLLYTGDRMNIMPGKVNGRFVALVRHPHQIREVGSRAVWRSESEDFLQWTAPELVVAPDLYDEPNVQIYGMSAFQRHEWFIGLVEYWHDTPDVIETFLAVSRDGKRWYRPVPRTPFIAATHDWNRAWSTCLSNGPILIKEQMVFYFGGRWTAHALDPAQQYRGIGYASLPIDRFCALEAKASGRLDTVALEWPVGELVLNADTRQDYTSHPFHCNGEIAVEVLDAGGAALPDWSGDNRARFVGNTHCRGVVHDGMVRWPGDRKLHSLKGQTIRLRFHFNHARLFTIEARGQR